MSTLGTRIQHVGLCTADMERAVRFYTEALGFVLDYAMDVAPAFEVLTELPGMTCRTSFLQHGGFRLELIGYEQPEVVATEERRPMNHAGLTHLCIIVDDLDATCERITRLGGRVYPNTATSTAHGRFVFCTDPDGVRVELWEKAA